MQLCSAVMAGGVGGCKAQPQQGGSGSGFEEQVMLKRPEEQSSRAVEAFVLVNSSWRSRKSWLEKKKRPSTFLVT